MLTTQSTEITFDELCQKVQSQQMTWLEFVQSSEYSDEFTEWCEDTGLSADADTAFLFLEKKESDSMAAASFSPLQIHFV